MKKNNIRFTDILVVLLGLVAVALIGIIIYKSKIEQQQATQALSNISAQLEEGSISIDGSNGLVETNTNSEGIILNEICYDGWVELYNSSKNSVTLVDYSIYLNGKKIDTKASIEIEGYGLFVWETNEKFGSSSEKDLITIKNKEDEIILSCMISGLKKGESYGAIEEGNANQLVMSSTKGESNVGATIKNGTALSTSVPTGFYTIPIQVEINVPSGTTVYYTTDGTTPTTESNTYTGGIIINNRSGSDFTYAALAGGKQPSTINMGTILKAIAVNAKGEVVDSIQNTYFIGIAYDSGLVNLPVLSITSDPDGLFSYEEGMYVGGRAYVDSVTIGNDVQHNYTQGWVRECHIDFFESNKQLTYESDANLSVLRYNSCTDLAQKGLLISDYSSKVNEDSSYSPFWTSGNHTTRLWTYNLDSSIKIRDYMANVLFDETSVGTRDMMPVSVFLNGEYWGVYYLKESIYNSYFSENYNVKDEDVTVGIYKDENNYQYTEYFGSTYQFVTENDMSDKEKYTEALALFDVDSYIDYICANVIFANGDYLKEDAYVWKSNTEGSKWKWILGDMGISTGLSGISRGTAASTDTFILPAVRNDEFFKALLANDSFRKKLVSEMNKLLKNNFDTEILDKEIEAISELTKKSMIKNYNRFYGNYDTENYTEDLDFFRSFFEDRQYYLDIYMNEVDNLLTRYVEIENEKLRSKALGSKEIDSTGEELENTETDENTPEETSTEQ